MAGIENKKQKAKRELKELNEALSVLPEIVKATNDVAVGCMYTPEVIYLPLVQEGLVEVNEAYVNQAGEMATRATQKGVEKVMSETENVGTEAALAVAAPVKQTYAILNVAIPEIAKRKTGGGRHGSKYPFESLEVGASFFVPESTDVPEPLKTMAASIANANARFAVPVLGEDGVTPKLRDVKNRKTGEVRQAPVMAFTKTFGETAYVAVENDGTNCAPGTKGALVFRKK